MTNGKLKMQSWQVLHFARKHLGRSALYIIFGKKNARIVDLWCEDPKTTGKQDDAYDPIRGVKDLLSALDDHGHTGTVRACLAFLRSGTSLDDDCLPAVTELLPTMAEEELADYHAVAAMQHAIDNGKPTTVVSSLKKAALEEIERTYAKYLEVGGNE